MPANDDDFTSQRPTLPLAPDASGLAALLLVESLIHGLCEKTTLSNDEAIDVVERAASVQLDQAEAAHDGNAPMWRSHRLLQAIAESLRVDAGGEGLSSRQIPEEA